MVFEVPVTLERHPVTDRERPKVREFVLRDRAELSAIVTV